jgi:uncharacterized protein (TIGR00369 family)
MTDEASLKPDEVLYFGNRIPFLQSIGVQPDELKLDYASARLSFRSSSANNSGNLHGGSLMSALDFVMSAAARSSDPAGLAPSTVDMRTSFIRPADSNILVVARCVHRGRSIAFCEATAHNQAEELVATASGVFKLSRKDAKPHAG